MKCVRCWKTGSPACCCRAVIPAKVGIQSACQDTRAWLLSPKSLASDVPKQIAGSLIMPIMRSLLGKLGAKSLELLHRQAASQWRKSQVAWRSEWHAPARSLRLLYLGVGVLIAWRLVPVAFQEVGVLGGISYIGTLFSGFANATFFRSVKIGPGEYVPLGAVGPIAMLIGLVGTNAVKPLVGDAKEAALAQDFVGAIIILGVFFYMRSLFGAWKSGDPYR